MSPKDSVLQKEYISLEKTEQEIPNIQEVKSKLTSNQIYIQDILKKSPTKKNSTQYVYKKGNNRINLANENFKQLVNQQKSEKRNNNINILNNENKIKQINQKRMLNNDPNLFVGKGKIQNTIQAQKRGKIKEENMNRNQEDIFIHNSDIINKDYLNSINALNSLYKINNKLQKIELSKSQDNQFSSTDSQSENQERNKYENYIKEYSKYLMSNPIDNYNNFSLNKLNIMPNFSKKVKKVENEDKKI